MLFIVILLTIIKSGCTDVPIISVLPVDTVGCYGGLSTFYCESNRTDIIQIDWTIDGDILTDETAQLRGISVNTNGGNSSLSIIGSESYTIDRIACVVATSDPPHIETRAAQFTVTDIPPVMNLTINFTTNGVMMCTWSQPSCLPINYSYSISVNNVSMINTTSTVYSMSNISSCTDYTVSVTVIDNSTQYQSLSSNKTAKSGFYKDLEADLQSTNVSFNDSINRFIGINFTYRELSKLRHCEQELDFSNKIVPPKYSYIDKNNIITVKYLLESYDESTGIGDYTIGPFKESFIGNYSLHTQDEEIARTKISTFHVQNASINQLSNGTTMMECDFAYNSPADGCEFDIIPQTKGNGLLIDLTKDEYEDPSTLYTDIDIPVGYYDVHVYDIVNGTIISPSAVNTNYHHRIYIVISTSGNSTATYSSSHSVTTNIATSSSSHTTTKSTMITALPTISQETRNNNIPTSIIIVAGILFMILLVIVIIVISVVWYKHKKLKHIRVHSATESASVQKSIAAANVYDDQQALLSMRQTQRDPEQTTQLVIEEIDDYVPDVANGGVDEELFNQFHDLNGDGHVEYAEFDSKSSSSTKNDTNPPIPRLTDRPSHVHTNIKQLRHTSSDTANFELSPLTTPHVTESIPPQITCTETTLNIECEQEQDIKITLSNQYQCSSDLSGKKSPSTTSSKSNNSSESDKVCTEKSNEKKPGFPVHMKPYTTMAAEGHRSIVNGKVHGRPKTAWAETKTEQDEEMVDTHSNQDQCSSRSDLSGKNSPSTISSKSNNSTESDKIRRVSVVRTLTNSSQLSSLTTPHESTPKEIPCTWTTLDIEESEL